VQADHDWRSIIASNSHSAPSSVAMAQQAAKCRRDVVGYSAHDASPFSSSRHAE
jgi:hypothetical protein